LPVGGDRRTGGGRGRTRVRVAGLLVERARGEPPRIVRVAGGQPVLALLGELRGAGTAGEDERGREQRPPPEVPGAARHDEPPFVRELSARTNEGLSVAPRRVRD